MFPSAVRRRPPTTANVFGVRDRFPRRLLGALFRRLPPVARRDQRIRDLQKKLDPPSAAPSYRAKVQSERRMSKLGRSGSSVISHGKFYVYDLVRSHGVEVPEQLGRWADPRAIRWDELPDRVVIKSMRGSNARGVLPLRRSGSGWQIITHDDAVLTGDEVADLLAERVADGIIKGPFGAEEFLDEDGTGTRSPMDVKVYTFYGSAPMALLRRVVKHGEAQASFRIVDRRGRDVAASYSGKVADRTLEPPARLEEMFEIAERLSVAIRATFSRIDLYSLGDRIVFGEVTPRPGGPQWFGPELDRRLGKEWERAEVRMSRDLAAGASPNVQMGPISLVEGVDATSRAPADAVKNPSYQARINAERRLHALGKELKSTKPPSVIAGGKFRVYDLVRSHGIDVPQQYGQWRKPAAIPWDDLPDTVVIKCAFATAARGVLPLRRQGDRWKVITRDITTTSDELTAELARRLEDQEINGPFGAEEFLEGGVGDELPVDVRTYAFYGHVPLILLRRPGPHGNLDAATFRPVDAHGNDLIDVEKYPALKTTDRDQLPRELAVLDVTIPVPKNIEDVVDAAQRLSKAIKLPFARIDLYGLDDRVVFGELTPRPGGRQWLGSEVDVLLGDAWERAEARLRRDLAEGMSPDAAWGPVTQE